jgi:hypothetical protein
MKKIKVPYCVYMAHYDANNSYRWYIARQYHIKHRAITRVIFNKNASFFRTLNRIRYAHMNALTKGMNLTESWPIIRKLSHHSFKSMIEPKQFACSMHRRIPKRK